MMSRSAKKGLTRGLKRLSSLGLSAVFLAAFYWCSARAAAPEENRGLVQAVLGHVKVSIDYGRPALNGRDPLSMIAPGDIWRVGADAPNTFSSTADLEFDGVRVPKGEHFLLVRYIDKGAWSLLFSSKPPQDYEPGAKVAEVPVQLEPSKDAENILTIRLDGNGPKRAFVISWGTLRLTGTLSVAK